MRVLFVDDDPENVQTCTEALSLANAADVVIVHTVEEAVRTLHAVHIDVLVMDLFIPFGDAPRTTLGPRARKYAENVDHLGGLVLLDELVRVPSPPLTLLHTACRDVVVMDLAREVVHARVRKPAPAEVLLKAVLDAIAEVRGAGTSGD